MGLVGVDYNKFIIILETCQVFTFVIAIKFLFVSYKHSCWKDSSVHSVKISTRRIEVYVVILRVETIMNKYISEVLLNNLLYFLYIVFIELLT